MCNHDWLFVKEVSRETESSKQLRKMARELADKGNANGILPYYLSECTEESGSKYTCAKCGEVKEVF